MQGTPTSSGNRVLDLNALLAERRLDPVEVKLGDATYMVNTDLTARESDAFLTLMRKGNDAAAFTILVGTKEDRDRVVAAVDRAVQANPKNPNAGKNVAPSPQGNAINSFIDGLPRMHQALVSGQLMRASKALAEFAKSDDEIYSQYGYALEQAGESTAS
jgi:hypothetical protein